MLRYIGTMEEKKIHYVCIGGCGKTSETQMKCATPFCWRARNPLGECSCSDGMHEAFYAIYNPEKLQAKKDAQ